MMWKPINFQGLIVIDKLLIDQLNGYFEEKKTRLASEILRAFQHKDSPLDVSLSEVLEKVKKNTSTKLEKKSNILLQSIYTQLNRAWTEYVEVLESCVVEFIQQLDPIRLDLLSQTMLNSILELKKLLADKIQECIEIFLTIQSELRISKRQIFSQKSWLNKWKDWFGAKQILNSVLVENLKKSLSFLNTLESDLNESYNAYQALSLNVQDVSKKLNEYPVLQNLNHEKIHFYKELYSHLKMWELNQKSKVLSEKEITHILRSFAPPEKGNALFHYYLNSINLELFDLSRKYKEKAANTKELSKLKDEVLRHLNACSMELTSFGGTVRRYREFLLSTDPNPYVRARWGFSDWVVGPEPSESKELMQMGLDIESLYLLFNQFKSSLHKSEEEDKTVLHAEILTLLHEIGQPLASRGMMRKKADLLIDSLECLDELGSSHYSVLTYMEDVLSKALRADWKYHVLHEISAFHKIYKTHIQLYHIEGDSSHRLRMIAFKRLFGQLEEWARKGEIASLSKAVEMNIQDIHVYLQDMLTSVDQIASENYPFQELLQLIVKKRRQLLEYRYLFGSFCHSYCHFQGDPGRSRYLFVDQQFEFIEKRLEQLTMKII